MVALHAALVIVALSGVGQTGMLDFYGDYCPPCRAMNPTVEALIAAGYPVQRINVSRDPAKAAQFKVDHIPCFVMLVDGREVDRVVGGTTYSRLERMCKLGIQATAPAPAPPAVAPSAPPVDGLVQPVRAEPAPTPRWSAPSWESQPPPANQSIPMTNPPAVAVPDAALIAASVRLRIEDPDGRSCGTGTIIDARGDRALVLTCGHIFRDSQGKKPVTVDLFGPGAPRQVAGEVISYDLARDVGLVLIHPQGPVSVARLAPSDYRVQPGMPVVGVGCNGGDFPTAQHSQITNLNGIQGPPNLQVAGEPVVGRSGGGLFTSEGYVIGVCNAADPKYKEGLFAALGSICAELDRQQMAFIYQSPMGTLAPTAEAAGPLAGAAGPGNIPPVAPPPMYAERDPRAASPVASGHGTTAEAMSPQELAFLEEVRRRQKEGAEVVCIVRPRDNPEARSEVIMLDRASAELLRQLAAEAEKRSPSGTRHDTSLEQPRKNKKLLEWPAPKERGS
jgi:thiol-disulfide isomerase/thioredoxin